MHLLSDHYRYGSTCAMHYHHAFGFTLPLVEILHGYGTFTTTGVPHYTSSTLLRSRTVPHRLPLPFDRDLTLPAFSLHRRTWHIPVLQYTLHAIARRTYLDYHTTTSPRRYYHPFYFTLPSHLLLPRSTLPYLLAGLHFYYCYVYLPYHCPFLPTTHTYYLRKPVVATTHYLPHLPHLPTPLFPPSFPHGLQPDIATYITAYYYLYRIHSSYHTAYHHSLHSHGGISTWLGSFLTSGAIAIPDTTILPFCLLQLPHGCTCPYHCLCRVEACAGLV